MLYGYLGNLQGAVPVL